MNFQLDGGIGVYFSIWKLAGTVTLSGSGVTGAIIRLVQQSTDLEVAKTTSGAAGAYSFPTTTALIPGENYHLFVEYTDGGAVKYNAKSLWNVNPVMT